MKKLLFYSLLFLLFGGCQEEKIEPDLFGTIVGSVLTEDGNEALESTTISTNPSTSLILTDELGRFTLEQVKTGTYTVRAELEGYTTQVENITVFEEQTANVIFKMSPNTTINSMPTVPMNPMPQDAATGQAINVSLMWESTDADVGDELKFDIILCKSEQTGCATIATGISELTYELTNLAYNTTYFWQIIADDGRDRVNSPVWSFMTAPFPSNRYTFARKSGNTFQIFSSDLEGNTIQLTNGSGDAWRPRVSPLRDKIAFISNAGIETHIYTMNLDGSEVSRITQIPLAGQNNLELDYSWSPDGAQLLYMNNASLYVVNRDGTGTQQIARAPDGFTFAEVDWNGQNDGRILVRTVGATPYESDIFLLDEQGEYLQQIFSDIPGYTGGPHFSIDGKSILYTHDISEYEAPDGRRLNVNIFLKNLEQNTTVNLSQETEKKPGTNDLDARFSPDGASIICVNTTNDEVLQKDIWILNPTDKTRAMVFENAQMPDWK